MGLVEMRQRRCSIAEARHTVADPEDCLPVCGTDKSNEVVASITDGQESAIQDSNSTRLVESVGHYPDRSIGGIDANYCSAFFCDKDILTSIQGEGSG